MAEGWKKARDEPVSDDHAEGEREEPKEEEASVADDGRRGDRMIKSVQVPEDLQQLYDGPQEFSTPKVFQESIHQQNLLAQRQRRVCVCSWKCPAPGFQEEL